MPDAADPERPDPEQLLRQVQAKEQRSNRGRLKIFLGYAGGVGKSFRIFDEGRRRKERGEEVIVGGVQPDVSAEVQQLLRGFEVIPLRTDLGFSVIDVPAILKRRPGVCIIDGLAYDNPERAKNKHRWQDVEELLDVGISVLTSLNVHYVLERQKQVEAIRDRVVQESVPEAFIQRADEIEIVDAPPEYAVTRSMERGGSAADAEELARRLSDLREIVLLVAAQVVDTQLERYLNLHGIRRRYGTHERVLVCVTPRSSAAVMIQRGRSQADRFHGELYVVYVEQEGASREDRRMVEKYLEVAREADAQVEVLRGEDPVPAILEYGRNHGITQIFVGHSQRRGWRRWFRANPVERLILQAEGMDIRIFPNSEPR